MISPVHLHLLINHIPIIGTVGALCLLSYGWARKNGSITNAGLVTLIVTGVITIIVYYSGEGAEESVEQLGIRESLIETHEQTALYALWSSLILAGFSLLLLLARLFYNRVNAVFILLMMIGTLGATGIIAWTSNTGGQIRHTEIRPDRSSTAPVQPAAHIDDWEGQN